MNKIALVKRTRGTETSQYLEEKTSTEIPLVVASERGPGQCLVLVSRTVWKDWPEWVTAPYAKTRHQASSRAGHV